LFFVQLRIAPQNPKTPSKSLKLINGRTPPAAVLLGGIWLSH